MFPSTSIHHGSMGPVSEDLLLPRQGLGAGSGPRPAAAGGLRAKQPAGAGGRIVEDLLWSLRYLIYLSSYLYIYIYMIYVYIYIYMHTSIHTYIYIYTYTYIYIYIYIYIYTYVYVYMVRSTSKIVAQFVGSFSGSFQVPELLLAIGSRLMKSLRNWVVQHSVATQRVQPKRCSPFLAHKFQIPMSPIWHIAGTIQSDSLMQTSARTSKRAVCTLKTDQEQPQLQWKRTGHPSLLWSFHQNFLWRRYVKEIQSFHWGGKALLQVSLLPTQQL